MGRVSNKHIGNGVVFFSDDFSHDDLGILVFNWDRSVDAMNFLFSKRLNMIDGYILLMLGIFIGNEYWLFAIIWSLIGSLISSTGEAILKVRQDKQI